MKNIVLFNPGKCVYCSISLNANYLLNSKSSMSKYNEQQKRPSDQVFSLSKTVKLWFFVTKRSRCAVMT